MGRRCRLWLSAFCVLARASRDLSQLSPHRGEPYHPRSRETFQNMRFDHAGMLAAMVLSLIFTFTYATWAAKSRRAEVVLLPLLDILQSVPILGFISVTVVFFMSLAAGRVLGAEFAAVFAIFTSQAWNMAFSFYQSLRTVPEELLEVSRFPIWRVDALLAARSPVRMPQLIWNMMSPGRRMVLVVASEAISVGNTTVRCGIGSYMRSQSSAAISARSPGDRAMSS